MSVVAPTGAGRIGLAGCARLDPVAQRVCWLRGATGPPTALFSVCLRFPHARSLDAFNARLGGVPAGFGACQPGISLHAGHPFRSLLAACCGLMPAAGGAGPNRHRGTACHLAVEALHPAVAQLPLHKEAAIPIQWRKTWCWRPYGGP